MSDKNPMRIIQANKVKDYLKDNKRLDGRSFNDIREINIETGVVNSADGSARITLGKTELIVGVKFGVGTPYPDNPDEGSVIFNLELTGIASPEYSTGPPSIESIEYGRVADRVIRSTEGIDYKKLCIEHGEKSFLVFIDCYVINSDGNLIDAAEYGAIAAMLNTRIPKLDENNKIISKEHTDEKLPIDMNKIGISYTFEKVDGKLLLDATAAEEEASDARFTLGVCNNSIVAYHKGKLGTFTKEEIDTMMDVAVSKYNDIKNKICDVK